MGYFSSSKPTVKIHFSRTEIRDLLLALLVITFAFAVALSIPYYGSVLDINWSIFPIYLLISLFAVGTGFLLHELGHKFTANRYGAWAEFRAWPTGLMMALMFALLIGIVWAAPGAVYISGAISREENGKISLSGPAVNLIFAGIFFPLTLFTTDLLLWQIFNTIYFINAFLAVFNLLPFRPLDGSKIFDWNKGIYFSTLILAILLLIPGFL